MAFKIITRKYSLQRDSEVALSLVIQVLCLVDSYMIWLGFNGYSLEDEHSVVANGSLCNSWACATPSTSVRFLDFFFDVH